MKFDLKEFRGSSSIFAEDSRAVKQNVEVQADPVAEALTQFTDSVSSDRTISARTIVEDREWLDNDDIPDTSGN